jgi:hypothetical protein
MLVLGFEEICGCAGLSNLAALRNQVVALPCASFESRSLPAFGGDFSIDLFFELRNLKPACLR